MDKLFKILISVIFLGFSLALSASPVGDMLERIDKGASKKFLIEIRKGGDQDWFELDSRAGKVVVRANSNISAAVGVNWYLKYYAGVHVSWNGMQAKLPAVLPEVKTKERHSTDMVLRYDFNYCTYSYSMPFWDWDRWEREIDWMAMHGINLPLAAVGAECVWRNFMLRLGYTEKDVEEFIAGPAFLAWFEMNNIEGWGGPLPLDWYKGQEELQKKILKRFREWGIEPVLPGYMGMMPHDAHEKLGLNVAKQEDWNGITRPSLLDPLDPDFQKFAKIYYEEQEKLFGKAKYYSMDPFHESKTSGGVDFAEAGKAVMAAMKAVNPKAVWVLQAWSENPRDAMTDPLEKGDLLILDLFSECRPMWGMESIWRKENGYAHHDWLFCMLHNFGGRIGLNGRMDQLLENWELAKTHPMASGLKGIGLSMEGTLQNPVMYELMCELPWRSGKVTRETWLRDYCFARYGVRDEKIEQAWQLLGASIYNCPRSNNQQGPHESIFCTRPSENAFWAYERSKVSNYYNPADVREAARLMLSVAEKYRGNNNFEYDLVDIVRQAVADKARSIYQHTMADYRCFNKEEFAQGRAAFRNACLEQDRLLGTRKEFMVGSWIGEALSLARNESQAALYEWNARVQITTWGNRICANKGKLHDYAHKEWNGILKDFYLPRWEAFFDTLQAGLDLKTVQQLDWYAIEEPWTLQRNPYPCTEQGDPVSVAKEVFANVIGK